MYNLLEYSDYCSKTSGSLWQNYRDEAALDNAGAITKYPDNHFSFIYKVKITEKTLLIVIQKMLKQQYH